VVQEDSKFSGRPSEEPSSHFVVSPSFDEGWISPESPTSHNPGLERYVMIAFPSPVHAHQKSLCVWRFLVRLRNQILMNEEWTVCILPWFVWYPKG